MQCFTDMFGISSIHRLATSTAALGYRRATAMTDLVGEPAARRVIKGVVFDMDGTLTVPCIDFAEMRRRVGVTEGDILHVIAGWSPERQAAAFAAIAEVEEQALKDMRVMPGALDLCRVLDAARIPRALVTRNVSASVDFFHRTHFDLPPFFPSLSREWTPYKPDPAALRHIAEHWGVQPSELVMIGDSAKDDIVSANRAGAVAILLDTEGHWKGAADERLSGELRPHFYATTLDEVARVLQQEVQLRPPAAAGPADGV